MPRAVRFSRTGGPDVLEIVEVDEPHAGAGRVRVAVRAAGLNPYDTKLRTGAIEATLPRGQGSEFAGIVDEIGPGVTGIIVGDEVIGWTYAAAQADFVVVSADRVAPKPASLDWPAAGGLGLVADTAWRSTSSLDLGPSDTVLVTGAGGGVGVLSAQFALATGATVVGTARTSDHEFLQRIGVLPVAYGTGELEGLRAVSTAYTAALDTVGSAGVASARALGITRINSVADLDENDREGVGTVGGGTKTPDDIAGFARAAAEGELILPVQETFPLADVARAYRVFETSHVLGKIVLTVP